MSALQPKAVLFDLDGTLVDTAPDLGAAANHVRAQVGLPPLPLADYRRNASAGARGLLGQALGITPEHPDFAGHRELFLAYYAEHLADASPLFEGMPEALQQLEAAGIPWGIVTNKPKRYTDALVAALGLHTRAAVVISADEVPRAKPFPDGLLVAAQRLGVPAETCIYIGDDKRDIDAGLAANMHTIAAAWGYEGAYPLSTWPAHRVAQTPADFLYFL